MEQPTRHPRHLGLTMLLLLGAWGCAHAPTPEMPGTSRVAAVATSWEQSLGPGGTVGLLGSGRPLNLMGAQPTREQGADMGARAVRSAVTSIMQSSIREANTVTVPAIAATLVGHLVVAPVAFYLWGPATLVGVGVGALSSPSAGRVAVAEAALTQAWENLQVATALQRHLVASTQERRPRLVPLPAPTLLSPGDALDEPGHGPEAMETILVVLGPRAHLSSTEGVETPNPALSLVLTVRILLIRRTDSTVLYDAQFEKESAAALPFTAWAAHNAQPLRAEVDRAAETLATQIVAQVFGTETF